MVRQFQRLSLLKSAAGAGRLAVDEQLEAIVGGNQRPGPRHGAALGQRERAAEKPRTLRHARTAVAARLRIPNPIAAVEPDSPRPCAERPTSPSCRSTGHAHRQDAAARSTTAGLLSGVGRPSASQRRTFQWHALPRCQCPAFVHHLRRPVRRDLAAVPQIGLAGGELLGCRGDQDSDTRFAPPAPRVVHLPRQTRPNLADPQRIDPILTTQILRRRGTGVVGRRRDGGRRTDRRPDDQSKPTAPRPGDGQPAGHGQGNSRSKRAAYPSVELSVLDVDLFLLRKQA